MHGEGAGGEAAHVASPAGPFAWVFLGVSGSGKSTAGARWAARHGQPFVDGDDLHPPENRARMAAGIPLDDAARAPWLDAVARTLAEGLAAGRPPVVACSGLKRAYRDRIRAGVGHDPRLRFVFLDVPEAELRRRLEARSGHFFPAHLLASQLATLERPDDEPDVRVWAGGVEG